MRLVRSLASLATPTAHNLTRPSPYIRRLVPSATQLDTKPDLDLDVTRNKGVTESDAGERAALESDFQLYPGFFNEGECRQLLVAGLWKLDRIDSVRKRRRRGGSLGRKQAEDGEGEFEKIGGREETDGLQRLFEGEYGFEAGHFDSVIHHYRETLLTTLPPTASRAVIPLLNRLYALLPSSPRIPLSTEHPPPRQSQTGPQNPSDSAPPSETTGEQTPGAQGVGATPRDALIHVLHLAPEGEILLHVDNVDASGVVIVGVSLGAERVLRLVKQGRRASGASAASAASSASGEPAEPGEPGAEARARDGSDETAVGWDVRLPSGTVYLQKDTVRYGYEHSILPYNHEGSVWDGRRLEPGHRISIMVRDAPTRPSRL